MQRTATGTKALILDGSKILILVKSSGDLDLPGGKVRSDESVIDGLQREIFEETRLIVLDFEPIVRWSFVKKGAGNLIKGVTFLCCCVGDAIILSDEHQSYFWINGEDFSKIEFRPSYGLAKVSLTDCVGWQQKARFWRLPQIN